MPSPSRPWMGDTMKSGRILRTLHFAIVSRAPLNEAQVRTIAPSDAKRTWAASRAARSVSTTRTLEPRATDLLRRAAIRFAVLCSQSPSH